MPKELEREIELLRRYRSPNITAYLDLVRLPTQCWIVMELCDAGSLQLLAKNEAGALPEPVVASLLMQLTRALAIVHSEGAIHRDIKAENVLLHSRGEAKLGAFGVVVVRLRCRCVQWCIGTPSHLYVCMRACRLVVVFVVVVFVVVVVVAEASRFRRLGPARQWQRQAENDGWLDVVDGTGAVR